jgi:hypothetical protein
MVQVHQPQMVTATIGSAVGNFHQDPPPIRRELRRAEGAKVPHVLIAREVFLAGRPQGRAANQHD